jgi:hypothetical protein
MTFKPKSEALSLVPGVSERRYTLRSSVYLRLVAKPEDGTRRLSGWGSTEYKLVQAGTLVNS